MENKIEETGIIVKDSQELVNLKTSDLLEVNDFWTKHNFGTRLTLIIFLISYLAVIIASFFGATIPDTITDMVFYSMILAYMTVTLGVNGLKILLEGIAKIKLGR